MGNWVGYGGTKLATGLLSILDAPEAVVDGFYLKYEDKTGMDIVFVPETLVAGRTFSDVGGNLKEGIVKEMRTTFGKIALLISNKGEVDLSYHKIEDAVFHTPEGGLAVQMINKTGAATVKGMVVKADPAVDRAFVSTGTSEFEPIGVVYEAGVADGYRNCRCIVRRYYCSN
jgi:hypothetical protein